MYTNCVTRYQGTFFCKMYKIGSYRVSPICTVAHTSSNALGCNLPGEAIAVLNCKEDLYQVISEQPKCTQEIEVQSNGSRLFVEPVTRLVLETKTVEECQTGLCNVYLGTKDIKCYLITAGNHLILS